MQKMNPFVFFIL